MADEDPREPFTRVTLGAIYSKLLDVEDKVIPVPGQLSDHEVRLRAIEKYMWIWIGASGILGAGAAQLISYLINK